MDRKHKNLRDVGLALRRLRDAHDDGVCSRASLPNGPPALPCGRLLRCGVIDGCTFEELRRPRVVVNLRMHCEDYIHGSLSEKGVEFLHIPADNSLEKYDTTDQSVRAWLLQVVRIFERDDLALPVLLHCRSGKDRTGVVVAALLSILGIPDALIIQEFLLSEGTDEAMIGMALAGIEKVGGPDSYFAEADLPRVRVCLLGAAPALCKSGEVKTTAPCSEETRWLQDDLQLMCKLAHKAADQEEAFYWYNEAAQAGDELARLVPLPEAAVALYYRGWALGQLFRWEEAHEAVGLGLALARRAGCKAQIVQKLEKVLSTFPDDIDMNVLEVADAISTPGDPHAGLTLLSVNEDALHWKSFRCPGAFSWLRCGELAACSTPAAPHLAALKVLGLGHHVSAEQMGEHKVVQEHLEHVVKQIARELEAGSNCLVHCTDGFCASGTALACFLVAHGLDDPVCAETPGQPKMTAGEAIEVLRALRPGSIASAAAEEDVHCFAQAAWGGHVERVQRAFTSRVGSTTCGTSRTAQLSRPAPASARVVAQPGDGNCLFHSMAYGLGQGTAATLRNEICSFMEKNPELSIAGTSLSEWVQMLAGVPVVQYARKMAKSAQWGGAPEIAACAHMRGVNIHVYERRAGGFELTVPFDVGSAKTLRVLYVGGVHYDALVF